MKPGALATNAGFSLADINEREYYLCTNPDSEYSHKTRRIITYEYVLLAGVTDRADQAGELVALLQTHPCKVNLIPFNPVADSGFQRPTIASQEKFREILDRAHIPVTIRFSKGKRVDAACGQLRRRTLEKTPAVEAIAPAKS